MRPSRLTLALARLSAGGVVFSVGFGLNSCVTNAAYTNLATGVGDGVIDTAAASAGSVDPHFDAIIVQPVAGFLSDLWSVFVQLGIPADPVFQNDLLVQ